MTKKDGSNSRKGEEHRVLLAKGAVLFSKSDISREGNRQ